VHTEIEYIILNIGTVRQWRINHGAHGYRGP